MQKFLRRKPSASMVVSIIALVVAASGTAVAATNLVSGDKLIKKHSLSGNRLRNHTITGTQVKLSKLGKVPSAANADHATIAANANELGGQGPSTYLTTRNRVGTTGIVKVSGTSSGNTVTLFTIGPFTATLTCTKTGAGTTLTEHATSTEANSDIDATLAATAGTSEDLIGDITTPTTSFAQSDNQNIDFEAPSGAQAVLFGADGVNSLGADCWANWAGIH